MALNNTGNPVPSDKGLDLQDNASTIDEIVNGNDTINRVGTIIKGLPGLVADVETASDAAIIVIDQTAADIDERAFQAILGLGLIYGDPIPDWTPALSITVQNQVYRFPATIGDLYVANKQVPFTTDATFNTDNWQPVQGVTTNLLGGLSGYVFSTVANMILGLTIDANSIDHKLGQSLNVVGENESVTNYVIVNASSDVDLGGGLWAKKLRTLARWEQDGATTGGAPVLDGPNVIAGHEFNAVAPDVHSCTIAGGGLTNNENVIGGIAANVFDSGVSNLPLSPLLGTESRYCVIGGGYDNVCNGLSNIITGMHCVIDILDIGFDANHSIIAGGSLHKILAGPYNVISGGTQNEVLARSGYSVIGGGGANKINITAQYSVIGGGNENQTSDLYSTIGGGNGNTVDAINATISGGAGNSTTQDNSTIAGGNNGVISGASQGSTIMGGINGLATAESSTVLAGRDNSSLANHTISSGFEAKAERAGQKAWAVGKFAVQGDAQTSVIILKISTTDATPTNLQDISIGVSFPFKADINIGYNIRIVGHRTDVQGDNIVIILEGMAHRASSGSWLIVDFADKIASTAGSVSWSARIFDSVGSLRIEVTGEAAKNINWIANVEYTENQG